MCWLVRLKRPCFGLDGISILSQPNPNSIHTVIVVVVVVIVIVVVVLASKENLLDIGQAMDIFKSIRDGMRGGRKRHHGSENLRRPHVDAIMALRQSRK